MDKETRIASIDSKNVDLSKQYHILDTEQVDIEKELKEIISESNDLKYHQGLFDAYCTIALHYIVKNYSNEALAFLRKAKVLVDYRLISESNYPKICVIYIIYYIDTDGDFDSAMPYYELGVKFAEKYDDIEGLVRLRSNFAVMCLANDNFDIALDLFLKAELYYRETDNQKYLMNIRNNLGVLYEKLGDNENAFKYFHSTYDVAKQFKDTRMLNDSAIGLSRVYINQGKLEKAEDLMLKTIQISKDFKSIREEIVTIVELSTMYYQSGKYRQAYDKMLSIKKQVDQMDSDWIKLNYYASMPKICAGVKHYKEAYNYEILYHEYDKAILVKAGEDRSHQIIEAEYRKTITRLETISKIGQDLTDITSIDSVVNQIQSSLKDIMSIDSIGIGVIKDNDIHFDHFFIEGLKIEPLISPLDPVTSLASWVVHQDREIMLHNLFEEYHKYIPNSKIQHLEIDVDEATNRDCVSVLYGPLKYRNKIIGVFTIQAYNYNAYSDEELGIFHIVSSYVSVALEHLLNRK